MLCLPSWRNCVVLIAATAYSSGALAMTPYEARDLCTGLAGAYINAKDKKHFTYVNGKFKIEGEDNQITVFDNSVPVATIQNFDFAKWQECLEKLLQK